MSRLTVFLGRLIGLFFLLYALAILANRHSTVEAAIDFMRDPPALMLAGITVLIAGLAIVLSHNRWSGGVLTVAVTIIGWIFIIRGFVILAVPRETLLAIFEKMNFDEHYYVYCAVPLIIGLFLTIASFTSSTGEG